MITPVVFWAILLYGTLVKDRLLWGSVAFAAGVTAVTMLELFWHMMHSVYSKMESSGSHDTAIVFWAHFSALWPFIVVVITVIIIAGEFFGFVDAPCNSIHDRYI